MTSTSIAPLAPSLPALVQRAAQQLASATTAAEVLDAMDAAGLAYDTARAASRFAAKKNAHDEVLSAVYRAQADALDIEAQAKRRLADEYDAAQARGEVAGHGGARNFKVPNQNVEPDAADLGLTRKAIHEARQVRDAEAADPGIVRRVVDAAVEERREPTRAEVRRAVAPSPAPRRKPLAADVTACIVDLTRTMRKAAALRTDDRFAAADIATAHGSDLLRAYEALTDWIEAVAPAAAMQGTPDARQWWSGSLRDIGETLQRLAGSLGGEE